MLKELAGKLDFEAKRRAQVGWDRRAKEAFVQQLIDFVANNKQQVTRCVASKVIAGQEPNKTNELLQALARLVRQRQSANNDRRPRTVTIRAAKHQSPGERIRQLIVPAPSSPGGDLAASDSSSGPEHTAEEPQSRGSIRDAATLGAAPSSSPSSSSGQRARLFQQSLQSTNAAESARSTLGERNLEKNYVEQTKMRLRNMRALLADISRSEETLNDSLLSAIGRRTQKALEMS